MNGMQQPAAAEGEGNWWVQTGSGEWVPGTERDYIEWLEEIKADQEDEIRQLKEFLQQARTANSLAQQLMAQQRTVLQKLWRTFAWGTETMQEAWDSGALQFSP
jgi:hypothetical protein